MLGCRACVRRCIDSILFDTVPAPPTSFICRNGVGAPSGPLAPYTARSLHSLRSLRPSQPLTTRRSYVSATTKTRKRDDDVISYGRVAEEKHMHSRQSMPMTHKPKDTSEVDFADNNKGDGLSNLERRQLLAEIRMYEDPVRLGEHVVRTLRRNDLKKAFDLVCMATKQSIRAIVSWNHIVDHEMKKGRVTSALKIYNAMKKRGQKPDSYTYTILLRGLADRVEHPTALEKALTIYKSISAENSAVRGPNVYHTNALLKVCARAGEVDTMFGIAAELPARGEGAPDNYTFTTILNVLTRKALRDSAELNRNAKGNWEQKASAIREEAVRRGIRMWDDIVGRWRAGDVWIDEELTCAMGRLLMTGGKEQYVRDVFALVEQAMAIPKQPALLEVEQGDGKMMRLRDGYEQPQDNLEGPRNTTFILNSTKRGTYAQPGAATFSLLMEACQSDDSNSFWGPKAARQYWDLLTSAPYSVIPDAANYHDYLRLLRRRRASQEATEIVCDQMAVRQDIKLERKAFVIAVSTCCRDKGNPNAFTNANKLVELMVKRMKDPDVKTLVQYVDLGIRSTDLDGCVRRVRGAENNIEKVLNFFNANPLTLKALSELGTKPSENWKGKDMESWVRQNKMNEGFTDKYLDAVVSEDKENTLKLVQLLTSAVDKLLDVDRRAGEERQFLTQGQRSRLRESKEKLSGFVTIAMIARKQHKLKNPDSKKAFMLKHRPATQEEIEMREKRMAAEKEDQEIREWVESNMPKNEAERERSRIGGFRVLGDRD